MIHADVRVVYYDDVLTLGMVYQEPIECRLDVLLGICRCACRSAMSGMC